MVNVYQRMVVGYHGCDRSVFERVLLGGEHLQPSQNRYDWLGKGIYFWEHGYQRALEFAEWKRGPAFVGAGVHMKSHVQVAVRDVSCILGYFVPRASEGTAGEGPWRTTSTSRTQPSMRRRWRCSPA